MEKSLDLHQLNHVSSRQRVSERPAGCANDRVFDYGARIYGLVFPNSQRALGPNEKQLEAVVFDGIENRPIDVGIREAVADDDQSSVRHIEPHAKPRVIGLKQGMFGDVDLFVASQDEHHVAPVLDVDRAVKLEVRLKVRDWREIVTGLEKRDPRVSAPKREGFVRMDEARTVGADIAWALVGVFGEIFLLDDGEVMRFANDAAIFVILFAKISAELRTSLPERPLDDQIRLHLAHLRRCGEPAVSWETVSFNVLIAPRRYAGVTRPPCQSRQCGVPDFHSYAPSGSNLTFESPEGFPSSRLHANLAHANRYFDHRYSV
ncbi:hypothetical protein NL528_32485 [Bradyrhizobium sp. Ash2021]|nr:hypothetical protein [Bradyrhizobium sp. Ash2021]WMT72694.1 hypothetical protein NL528_32485 [Bradyrhizobium sp. Ash2021]